MFLKSLIITSESKLIREINFKKGMNLIIDETGKEITGNNVGKTTVLKLIDFCLGAKPQAIWIDTETKKEENLLVKNFLKDKNVLITLILKADLDDQNSQEITIERNFQNLKKIVRRINGDNYTEDEFEPKLAELIFPTLKTNKPTFRQVISHSIRYRDETISNTLKTLDRYTSDAEYETLHLFLLGVDFEHGNSKQFLLAKLKQEETFKSRLEKNQTRNAYETALSIIESDIEQLSKKKSDFNLNESFEADLDKLTEVKYKINSASSEISNFSIRRELILEADRDLRADKSEIDLQQLQMIYAQATERVEGIQRTFEELVEYHNQMVNEKIKFITKELPSLDNLINIRKQYLERLLTEERNLGRIISKSASFEELEKLIVQLNEKYQKKGEYENIISQVDEVESEIKNLNKELENIDDALFSDEFEQNVKIQVNKFNKFFATVSNELYDEKYGLKFEIVKNKKGKRVYKFNAFNLNFSTGKKQGEISCFDIAYIQFADDENIPCLHFILNDKKELMHDNQLVKIKNVVEKSNIQFVASILKDKLPGELNNEEYFILKLSENDKLFRIE